MRHTHTTRVTNSKMGRAQRALLQVKPAQAA